MNENSKFFVGANARSRLNLKLPWAVVRITGSVNQQIARFQNRTQAELHARAMQQLIASSKYEVIFDVEVK